MQEVCGVECGVKLGRVRAEKETRKKWAQEKKQRKESLTTASDWRNLLQQAFNAYIRERDKFKPCISCDRPLTGKFDAGHFYSVGSYPNLRYDENNCHGQCVHCNRDKHGNHAEYSLRLPDRIGMKRVQELTEKRNGRLSLTIDEIKEKIHEYRERLRVLQRGAAEKNQTEEEQHTGLSTEE